MKNKLILKDASMDRVGFYALLVVAVIFLWLPDFPVGADMPQHAGQVAALKAMIQGNFLWKDLVEVNYLTPYWGAYGLWVLLALIFPFLIATKIIVSLAFLSFVMAFSFLRKKFDAPPLLDWLLIPTFFSMPYRGGVITFLLAIAVGVWFYTVNIKVLEGLTWKRLALVFCAGIILMFSHMMVFCFFVLFSFIHFLCDGRIMRERRLLLLLIPYILLLFLFIMFSRIEHPLVDFSSSPAVWYGIKRRLLTLPLDSFSNGRNTVPLNHLFLSSVFLAASIASPFILGYQLSKKVISYSLMISFLCAWLFLPNASRFVFVIQERFVLFFIPAYILCFTRGNMPSHATSKIAAAFFVVLIASLMFYPLKDLYLFKAEAAKFSALLQDVPGNKRALMVIRARNSTRVKVPFVYIHFPLWYQALKGGWVEYNTAWAYVAPVRYLPDKVPEVRLWDDWALDLTKLRHCEVYDLIFVRLYDELGDDAFSKSPCQGYQILTRRDEWYVFQKNPKASAQ